jgi:hypothetical protein
MAEEKPLFLIDIDRAIEGLQYSLHGKGSGPVKIDPLIMHCIDLSNALDGAGLDDLSVFASGLAEQFKINQAQAFLLTGDLINITQNELDHIYPNEDSQFTASHDALSLAKTKFSNKLTLLQNGDPIDDEGVITPSDFQTPRVDPNPAWVDQENGNDDNSEYNNGDSFPNQEFYSDLTNNFQEQNTVIQSGFDPLEVEPTSAPAPVNLISDSNETAYPSNSFQEPANLNSNELSHLFSPRLELPPIVFVPPQPKSFSLPEDVVTPIDRGSSFDYSSKSRYHDKHFAIDRANNLNRMQKARNLIGNIDTWSGVEVDFLLSKEQDELVRAGQQSLRHIFENLTDELLIDEVYADPSIAQQLLTIISILPPCPSIFAVQQDLMIFIDLDHLTLSSDHRLAVSSMMAEISGTFEIHERGIRLSCPSSLLRMPMAYFSRHGEQYAVSAVQYLGEQLIQKPSESKIDALGEIIHPAKSIFVRAGGEDYVLYAHEFLGVQNMNIHCNIPKLIERPYWLAGIALDGSNRVHSWVALDRHAR